MPDDLAPLLAELRRTAVERDKRGGHPAEEKALLQAAGLLRLSIPAQLGGDERPWPEIFALVRRVATVDSALAHLLAFHHLQVATLRVYGSEAQQRCWLGRTIAEGGWWGNAMNPLDAGLTASAHPHPARPHRLQAGDARPVGAQRGIPAAQPVHLSEPKPRAPVYSATCPDHEDCMNTWHNRDNSADSRVIGLVPRQLLVGKAHPILVSADILGNWLPRLERIAQAL